MASSRKYASLISRFASCIYFLVIFFQIPLFRVPCRSGICKTPIEVTCTQLMATELFPPYLVKSLLYPGAFANAIYKKKNIPTFDSLPRLYRFTQIKSAPPTSDLQRLEVLTGSYLSVAGSIAGLIRPGRMSLFGILLIVWGIVREVLLGSTSVAKLAPMIDVRIYPSMSLALVFAVLSIRRDVRRIFRGGKTQPFIAKSSWKAKQF